MPLVKRYTFTTGARLSSSQLNTNFDDIYNTFNAHSHTNQGNDAPQITTSGIAGGVLTPTNFYNPIKFSVYMNSNTSLAAGAIFPFDTKTLGFDTSSNVDLTVNKGRFTVPVNGFYFFSAIGYATTPGGQIWLSIKKNGTVTRNGVILPSAAVNVAVSIQALMNLVVGDYIEIVVNNGAGAATWNGGIGSNAFEGFLVSAT